MTTQTLVFGANMRRSERWRLYQLRTANSTYELEVQSPTPGEVRRCCVLTCVSPPTRAGQTFEDSAPRAGDESLFASSPLDWIGKCITVGTARTSVVQSVEFVSASDAPAPRRSSAPSQSLVFGVPTGQGQVQVQVQGVAEAPTPRAPKPASQEPLTWAPFPLGYVQMAEAAASVLQVLNNRSEVQGQLGHDPLLRRRLEHALATCRLMLEAMGVRG